MATVNSYSLTFFGAGIGRLDLIDDNNEMKVLDKLPLCRISKKYKVVPELSPGDYQTQGSPEITCFFDYITMEIDGIVVFSGIPVEEYIQPIWKRDIEFYMYCDPIKISFIESKRTHDLSLEVKIRGKYKLLKRAQPYSIDLNSFTFKYTMSLSESRWLEMLKLIGFGEKMIIEIDQPKLEGFNDVMDFIGKAAKGITENVAPEDIVSNLRSAWDKMEQYLGKYQKEIKDRIGEGSGSKSGEPTKDERIDKIRKSLISFVSDILELKKDVDKLTQIGPHREVYSVRREDAILAYRLTVSLISYYSGLLKQTVNSGGGTFT